MRAGTGDDMGWLNSIIDSKAVLGALLVAAITTVAGLLWRNWHPPRELSWSVLYDEEVNKGADKWEITYQGTDISDGSLVILDVSNPSRQSFLKEYWETPLSFAFVNRKIKGYKIRDPDRLHEDVKAQGADSTVDPRTQNRIQLPPFSLNPGTGFKLTLLLSGDRGLDMEVEPAFGIREGGLVRHDRRPTRFWYVALPVALAVLAAGVVIGVRLANSALTPSAACASETVLFQGSTAFAPVVNQARNSYRQLCPNATVLITADGSGKGLADLETSGSGSSVAMSDGLPGSQHSYAGLTARPVGVVTYALVANTALISTYPNLFGQNGISADDLRQLFSGAGDPTHPSLFAVGRSDVSGTRTAFAHAYFGGVDPEPAGNRPCGVQNPSGSHSYCTEDSTMDLLGYVESHPYAIGYAEADALPFFPDVQVIGVDGHIPSTASVEDGSYPFVATEYLFTDGAPTGLTADFLDFLTSGPEIAALRGHGFIACQDLTGTRLDGACNG
ncbi:phosphate transport system substrate-binding protein [Streptacidiphilus sp. MAP5-3]